MARSNERNDLKRAAHIVFDRLWKTAKNKKTVRGIAHHWLSEQIGKDVFYTHMGCMTDDELRQVIRLCRGVTMRDILDWDAKRKNRARRRLRSARTGGADS